MDNSQLFLGISNIFVATLIIGISIPLVMRKVPMNSIYGIRFKRSFESEEKWYDINEFGGKKLILWSIPLILMGLVIFLLPQATVHSYKMVWALAPLIYFIPAFQSYFYSKRM